MKNICVVGVGYVGLTTGACFADLGNQVIALDINEKRVEDLKKAIMPIYEPGLKEIVERNIRAERLKFTTNYEEALKDAEFAFICVGTPEGEDGEADLQYVRSAASTIAQIMDHPLIVINKSTVPIGTGDLVAKIIRENQPKPIKFSVVSCPEFLREGSAVRDFFQTDRVVLGSTDQEACHSVAQLYMALRAPFVITDLRTAEMIKYASNAFLATRISFINEIANICEALGADVKEVAQGMGYDKRIGHHFLEPGVGYGGSCFTGQETVFVVENGNVIARSFESLFATSGEPKQGGFVDIIMPNGMQVLAFDLLTGCPTVAEVKALTRRPFDGVMVTIATSMGRKLKVTADHPVILHKKYGFDVIPAFEVKPGDELIALCELPSLDKVPDELLKSIEDYRIEINQKSMIRYGTFIPLNVEEVCQESESLSVFSLETETGTFVGKDALILHNCFPKDVKALAYMAQIHGTEPQLLQSVMDINKTQRKQIVLKLQDMLGDVKGKAIGLLGLAFKENTDDIRESPALEIADMLHDQGAIVRGYDPEANENVSRSYHYIHLAEDAYELAVGCEALVVGTPWNEFKALDMGRIMSAMKQPIMIDGRNLYDPNRMKELGFHYRGVGRGYNGALEPDQVVKK